MRKFLKSENLCLRMIIARHFDPECNPVDIYDMQPGDTDAQKAENCCIVCRTRGTMTDPGTVAHDCPCGNARDLRTPFCPNCGQKNSRFERKN